MSRAGCDSNSMSLSQKPVCDSVWLCVLVCAVLRSHIPVFFFNSVIFFSRMARACATLSKNLVSVRDKLSPDGKLIVSAISAEIQCLRN